MFNQSLTLLVCLLTFQAPIAQATNTSSQGASSSTSKTELGKIIYQAHGINGEDFSISLNQVIPSKVDKDHIEIVRWEKYYGRRTTIWVRSYDEWSRDVKDDSESKIEFKIYADFELQKIEFNFGSIFGLGYKELPLAANGDTQQSVVVEHGIDRLGKFFVEYLERTNLGPDQVLNPRILERLAGNLSQCVELFKKICDTLIEAKKNGKQSKLLAEYIAKAIVKYWEKNRGYFIGDSTIVPFLNEIDRYMRENPEKGQSLNELIGKSEPWKPLGQIDGASTNSGDSSPNSVSRSSSGASLGPLTL